jgi:hypothetical protein
MSKKGPIAGCGSDVYFNSYQFFEKLRIHKNEEKSNKRLKNEKENPEGLPLREPSRVWIEMFPPGTKITISSS